MEISKKLFMVVMMVLAVALFSGQAFAQAQISSFSCTVRDGSGGFFICDPGLKGNHNHEVLTPSGMVILKCNCGFPFDAPAPPGTTELTEGFPCITDFGEVTFDTRSVVTKKGRSNLTCIINPTAP